MEVMMGGACSMQRQERRNSGSSGHKNRCLGNGGSDSSRSRSPNRMCSRHAVVSAVPDDFISNLYPPEDNYILENNGLRSPKSLSKLCTDTLCRSLPYLDGALPPGLPQDIVDDVTSSLVKHSALNATTLRVLRNCELGTLVLNGCRGVTDEWLIPLNSSSVSTTSATPPLLPSPPLAPVVHRGETTNDGNTAMPVMNLDDACDGCHSFTSYGPTLAHSTHEVFYNAKLEASSHDDSAEEGASSCSTSSFVSASSTNFASATMSSTVSSTRKEDRVLTEESKSMKEINKSNADHHCDGDYAKESTKLASISCPQPDMNRHFGICITSNITLLDLRGSQRLTDKGLLQLSDLSSLEIAKLDNCHSIQGRGLIALARSCQLHTLSLANCRRLTDEAIINISHLISLEALSLDGCRCLTDRSLVAISNLVRIKKLDLSQCDLITDSGCKELEHCENIEELSLGWCRSITDQGIETLASQHGRSKNMRILSLARIPITNTGIQHVGKLISLEELDLNGCFNIGSQSLGNMLATLKNLTNLDVSYCPGILRSSWQGKIKSLKTLDVCYSAVRDSHIARLIDLPELEEINLDSCPIGDWSISHLADNDVVPNLLSLDLADTDLSDLGMIKIAKFKKLKRLSLFYCNLTNSSLRHLESLSSLEVLNLDSRDIGDNGLMHLWSLQNLKSLDIFSGRVTDRGCAHISKIKSLESLELCGGGISDEGCFALATLENLVTLNLSQNERITNRGAEALAALSKLKALNLSNTHVSSGALIHFSHLRNLKSLALYGCQDLEETNNGMLDRLQNGLPNLKCVRLHNGYDDAGVIVSPADDTDDEDLESNTEEAVYRYNVRHNRAIVDAVAEAIQDTTDSGDESDIEMEDAFDSEEEDDDDDDEDRHDPSMDRM
uniref:F-box/LRR-repeat protein 15-like leucin rich repeat domain-containing protein n=1 Tax=Pseudo-nitzschia australis TaxID=44445 RepID=A0A7S4AJR3_9STRA